MDLITIGDFSISVTSVAFLVFSVFLIVAVGYLLGRITIKGISLGSAGVFIIALLYGCFFYDNLSENLMIAGESYVKNALKVVENMGLILFVTSVGFIAGPNFFGNFKKNFKNYVLLGLVIIITGGLTCAGCILLEKLKPYSVTAERVRDVLPKKCKKIIFLEEGIRNGGAAICLYDELRELIRFDDIDYRICAIDDDFITGEEGMTLRQTACITAEDVLKAYFD